MKHRVRSALPLAVVGVLVVAGVVGLSLRGGEEAVTPVAPIAREPSRAPQPVGPEGDPPQRSAVTTPAPAAPPAEAESAGEPAAEETVEDPDAMQDAIAAGWASVDMEAVRAALPDNLYFKLAAPTKDEAVIEERAAERRRWNDEYGKVLSGTASEEEIGAFFDRRARVSTDYVEFTTYLLDHYRDTLHERDVALLELARRMHATRLQEIPRQVEEALVRKQQQDEARAAWLAGEAEFHGEKDAQ